MIQIGDRLGLYTALDGAGPVTAAELSERTGLHERWLLEWLKNQAAARLLDYHDGDRFELTAVGAAVLADEENSIAFAAGAFTGATPPDTVDKLVEVFKPGLSVSYQDLGPCAAHRTERMLDPWTKLSLVPKIIPALDGVAAKLESGTLTADVGCGAGVALLAMAEAYPKSEFHGFDPSGHAIERAEASADKRGLKNIKLHHARWDMAHQRHSEQTRIQGQPEEPDARDAVRFLGFVLYVCGAFRRRRRRTRNFGLQPGGSREDGSRGRFYLFRAARFRRSRKSLLRSASLRTRIPVLQKGGSSASAAEYVSGIAILTALYPCGIDCGYAASACGSRGAYALMPFYF